jgi:hypothetical protein
VILFESPEISEAVWPELGKILAGFDEHFIFDEKPEWSEWPILAARARIEEIAFQLETRRVVGVGQKIAAALGLADRRRGRFPIMIWSTASSLGKSTPVAILPDPESIAGRAFVDGGGYAHELQPIKILALFLEELVRQTEQADLPLSGRSSAGGET